MKGRAAPICLPMKIHRNDHTAPTENPSYPIRVEHADTKDFRAFKVKNGVTFEVKDPVCTWSVTLSRAEVEQLRKALLST